MSKPIGRTSTIVAAKDQVSCDLHGEGVVLNLESGVYYGMDEVAARIWSLIQEPKTVREILDTIFAEYEVDHERCQRDIAEFLGELADRGLVEITHEANT